MKIAFTIAHMSLGGTQRVCINLIRWLQTNTGAEVELMIYSDRKTNGFSYDLTGIKHLYLNKVRKNRILAIRECLKSSSPDILVSLGTPCAIYDIPASRGLGIKVVTCERNDPAHFAGKNITKWMSHALMRLSDGFILQTHEAQSFYGGVVLTKGVVIPNPLFDIQKLPTRDTAIPIKKEIVTVGRLNKQKNHALLIQAFALIAKDFPDYTLIIYGSGPEEANDRHLIDVLGLNGKVILAGSCNDVLLRIMQSSLFVLSSDFEGMPNALIEAMAIGLPCISTDCPCGGPRELIENKENGLLIPVKDSKSLAETMAYVLRNNSDAYEMGEAAKNIRLKLEPGSICQQWYDYLKEIIEK